MSHANQSPMAYLEAIKNLSAREGEILDKIAEGKTTRQIAEELFLSTRTVENHRANICKTINVSGRGALEKWISSIIIKKAEKTTTQNNE